jgi:hypothetical protein
MSRSADQGCPYHRGVSEFQDADLRVADSEREAALTVLGEHMSAGRLNIDEYGERSAQVSTAKTRGELRALFSDLPPPHPQFGATGMPAGPTAMPVPSQPVGRAEPWRPTRALLAGLVPVAAIIAVGLFFITHLWLFFLIPAAVMAFGSSVYGRGWRDDHRGDRRRDYRDRGRDRDY